jgi:hypothetical protein
LAVALASPTTTWADPPHLCPNCQAQQQAYQQQSFQQQAPDPAFAQQAPDPAYAQQGQPTQEKKGFWHHKHTYRSVRMCANCMQAQQAANGGAPLAGPPMFVATHPGCAGCQSAAVAAGGYPAMGGAQPGMAVAGGPGDPVPVGVMQATYSPGNGAPGRAVVGGHQPLDPANFPPAPPLVGPEPGHPRPHIIAHMFGLRSPDSPWAMRREREKMAHAAIPFGPQNPSAVTELPASEVYRR